FFFQAEDGIRDFHVTGVQTCALPIWLRAALGDLDGWRAVAFVVVSTPVRVVGLGAVALAAGTAVALVASPVAWLVLDPTKVAARSEERRVGTGRQIL